MFFGKLDELDDMLEVHPENVLDENKRGKSMAKREEALESCLFSALNEEKELQGWVQEWLGARAGWREADMIEI